MGKGKLGNRGRNGREIKGNREKKLFKMGNRGKKRKGGMEDK